jgi:hypothetical protein
MLSLHLDPGIRSNASDIGFRSRQICHNSGGDWITH